jgi:DNA mismatch repair protein MutL
MAKTLLIIDQHVAHERVLYEKALKELENPSGGSQQQMFPINIELSPREKSIFEENIARFERMGFSVKLFSGNTIVVEAVPVPLVRASEVEKVVKDMLYYLMENEHAEIEPDDRFAKSYACGAAVKAGQELSQEEMNMLVDMLFQCRNKHTCPHGRPIWIRLSLEEIAKRFLR